MYCGVKRQTKLGVVRPQWLHKSLPVPHLSPHLLIFSTRLSPLFDSYRQHGHVDPSCASYGSSVLTELNGTIATGTLIIYIMPLH